MPLFELTDARIIQVEQTTFEILGLRERSDLQRLLRESIHIIDKDLYVLSEEYGDWEDARRRIDLLCLDREANLVVVELKRTEDGGHMELQALRYAAMLSTLTFENIVEAHSAFLRRSGSQTNSREAILQFLGASATQELTLGDDVRIVLASADFSRELTTTVLWLNERDLDIRCVRIRPYRWQGRTLVDIQQVLPLPEASDYQVKIREKAVEKRAAERKFNFDFSKYDLTIDRQRFPNLTKRALGFRVLRAAVDGGISPDELSKHLGKAVTTWIITVDGTLSAPEFALEASKLATKWGKYDLGRFFCGEGELVHKHGRSYAITNQWAINDIPALEAIAEKYPDLNLFSVGHSRAGRSEGIER